MKSLVCLEIALMPTCIAIATKGVCVLYPGMSVDLLSAWRLANGFFHASGGHSLDTEPSAHRPGQGKGAQTHQLRDGRWMLAERYRLANGINVGLWIDITALKQAEAALRETAEHLAAARSRTVARADRATRRDQ